MASKTTISTHKGVTMTTTEIDMGADFIEREIAKLSKGANTQIGFFAGKSFDPSKDIVARAYVQEYGTLNKHIPKRPFNRQAFDNNKQKIEKQKVKEYDRILAGKQTAKTALGRLGEWYLGKLKMTIKSGRFVPNKPVTIKRKKSSAPLINTGQMRDSATHKEFNV